MKWFESLDDAIYPQMDDREKALYRIIPFDILLQMLNEKKNTLVRTSLWEDVYENFMLKENIVFKDIETSLARVANQFYGQCWTSKASSDAMWRIYSPDKKSVRIKTTIGKLWDGAMNNPGGGKYLIGKVQYFPQSKIEKDIADASPFKFREFCDLMTVSLFVKRNSFSHENEYRLIYFCDMRSDENVEKTKSYQIDPLKFIMNISFDPRADEAYVDRCKKILVEAFNYPKKNIHKAKLYDFKPCKVEVVV